MEGQQLDQLANKVLTLIMAGGKGSRLEPLTTERAKPAVLSIELSILPCRTVLTATCGEC
jgi:mannose-1-phosphate guanylyltransferase